MPQRNIILFAGAENGRIATKFRRLSLLTGRNSA
jgi:hypothetical protein